MAKSTWWSVTAFKPAEIAALKDNAHYPTCVRNVFGGIELCPETNREHFQGAIQCHQQQRMSAFKTWLPTSHLEPAHHAEALRKYAMKPETAIEEKKQRENLIPHYSCDEIMLMVANELMCEALDDHRDNGWRCGVNRLLRKNIKLAGQLQNPSNRAFWILTSHTWVQTARQTAAEKERQELASALVLQQRHSECRHGTNCVGCSECEAWDRNHLNAPRLEIIETNGHDTPPQIASRILEGVNNEDEDFRSCQGSEDTQGEGDRDS